MFPYPDDPSRRWWLLGLLILWVALLFGGFLFGSPDAARHRRMPTWTRMASSLTLVIAAWSWYVFSLDSPVQRFSLLLAVGMTLGFVGDLFMANLLPVSQPILGGIGAFGLGHIAYIAALVWFGNHFHLDEAWARWGGWGSWLLIGLAGWSVMVMPSAQPAALRWAALPYTLLLASTAGFATGLALQAPAFIPLAVGTGLFLASDLILAGEIFRQWRWPFIGDVVWLTYGPGQMLIVYAVAGTLAVARSG